MCPECGRKNLLVLEPARTRAVCEEYGWDGPVSKTSFLSLPQPKSADPIDDLPEAVEMTPGIMNERLG